MFVGGTGEEALGAGAGADNGTDGGRRKDSNTVTGPYGKKYETDSKNMTSADTILLVGRTVTPVSFLSSRMPNKDTFDRPRRMFSNP